MGNWMMRVPADPDPSKLKSDLDAAARLGVVGQAGPMSMAMNPRPRLTWRLHCELLALATVLAVWCWRCGGGAQRRTAALSRLARSPR